MEISGQPSSEFPWKDGPASLIGLAPGKMGLVHELAEFTCPESGKMDDFISLRGLQKHKPPMN
jgi:hypothetical protein